jgi:hypothetical protein
VKHVAAVKGKESSGDHLVVGKDDGGGDSPPGMPISAQTLLAPLLRVSPRENFASQILAAVVSHRPQPLPKMSLQQPTEATTSTTTDGVHGQVQARVILVGIGYVIRDCIRTHAYMHI